MRFLDELKRPKVVRVGVAGGNAAPRVLTVLLLSLLPGLAAAQAPPRRPIIDVHLHAQSLWAKPGEDAGVVFGPVFGQRTLGIPTPGTTDELREGTLAALDRYNIVKAMVGGPHALRYREGRPQRVLASFETPGRASPDSLRIGVTSGRFVALAELAPQYLGISPSDSAVAGLFAVAEELDVPVGIHMGLGPPGAAHGNFPNYRMSAGDPLLLEDVLVRHPRLRVWVMHAGWPRLGEMVALMHAHPDVYVDIAVINWYLPMDEFYAYFERLVKAGFADRIMFGTDQMQWPDAIGRAIETVEAAPFLTPDQRRDIMCRNAARFLRLEAGICE
jgi:uncharacterized protein